MHVYKLDKLVRDTAVDNMEADGAIVHLEPLDDATFKVAALQKVAEEALEAIDAKTPDELAKELGDMLQIIHTLAPLAGKRFAEIDTLRIETFNRRLGFDKRLFVSTVECPPGSKWDLYFAQNPDKNPRLR